jgi:hypothetical protein
VSKRQNKGYNIIFFKIKKVRVKKIKQETFERTISRARISKEIGKKDIYGAKMRWSGF